MDDAPPKSGEYQVVARRYRPQSFHELIGQQHVAKALSNAIAANRVGHAYLFTGARGVGKTSAARILAKALDCVRGPTATPCNQCDVCESISAGSDVDVLEIDGASNRGIDEIRQLRQNVSIRPSRARFKIYIIDEVHMLTREAFNALLKTLEEPPEHVKFIFCTTEASKIPITILSRCQRFDFAGIRTTSIAERLLQIVAAEGVTAEPAALELLARRANGSMRDSQSLLEQLLSFGEQHLTVADVNALLGTAGDARLVKLLECIVDRRAGETLVEIDAALAEGVDVGQLLEQLLGFLRDCMAAAVGCGVEAYLYASPESQAEIARAARQLGLETILAMVQIVEQTLNRLRYSTQGRILLEIAIVRLCALENLEQLSDLVAAVAAGADSVPQKKSEPVSQPRIQSAVQRTSVPLPVEAPTEQKPPVAEAAVPIAGLTEETAVAVWKQTLEGLDGLLFDFASSYERVTVVPPNKLVVSFPARYNQAKPFCEQLDRLNELERVASEAAGCSVRLQFEVLPGSPAPVEKKPSSRPSMEQRQRTAAKADHPLVKRAAELFGAEIVRIHEPD
jgi:DNA polymerase-3 subunit gamma/tau